MRGVSLGRLLLGFWRMDCNNSCSDTGLGVVGVASSWLEVLGLWNRVGCVWLGFAALRDRGLRKEQDNH